MDSIFDAIYQIWKRGGTRHIRIVLDTVARCQDSNTFSKCPVNGIFSAIIASCEVKNSSRNVSHAFTLEHVIVIRMTLKKLFLKVVVVAFLELHRMLYGDYSIIFYGSNEEFDRTDTKTATPPGIEVQEKGTSVAIGTFWADMFRVI